MSNLILEKVNQAVQILNEKDIDLWLTFTRETSLGGDPILPVIYGSSGLTWPSAVLIARSGERIVILGHFEAENARLTGAFSKVIPYDRGIREILRQVVARLNPRQMERIIPSIFSTHDPDDALRQLPPEDITAISRFYQGHSSRKRALNDLGHALDEDLLGRIQKAERERAKEAAPQMIAFRRRPLSPKAKRWIVDMHPYLGAVGLTALALHIVAAVSDSYVGLRWVNTIVPFTAGWRPWGVAFGVVSLWVLVAVQGTSMVRKRLDKTTWHRIHLASYVGAWMTGVHAVMNGSDLGNPVIAWTAFALLASATVVASVRALRAPAKVSPPATPPARRPELVG